MNVQGATVVDLGCGSGRDVYTVAQLVGENGKVIGLDMTGAHYSTLPSHLFLSTLTHFYSVWCTEAQLVVARRHAEWQRIKFGYSASNVEFRSALIEDLHSAGLEDESVDVVISNCVVNLAEDKKAVLKEVKRVLKSGGELFFSDVYADRRVPELLKGDKVSFWQALE